MNETKLNVQSIFHSIDGEVNGFYGAGEPSTFIRLKGCNLRCSFCDTKYSQESEPSNWMTIDEVIKQIKFSKVTITGGEPLLQKSTVEELCSILLLQYNISIETNGTIVPSYFHNKLRYIMDWKLPSSQMECRRNLMAFGRLRKEDIIKFVISDWKDYNRAREAIRQHPEWCARKVFSPAVEFRWVTIPGISFTTLAIDPVWPQKLLEQMLLDKLDIQFSLQIHKVIWPGATTER